MAFSAEGWRKLVVGELVFYWRDWRANFDALFVRPEVEPYRLLRVTENRCPCGPHSGWSATPGVARAAVDCAIEHGWLTTQPALRVCAFSDLARCAGIRHEWLTSTVIALVHGIRDRGTFDAMPILADALQDSGCENADILDHCRAAGPHVRGCWVVDLLLGRA
jgi:hypothetical protein